jgi:hypothetical protein
LNHFAFVNDDPEFWMGGISSKPLRERAVFICPAGGSSFFKAVALLHRIPAPMVSPPIALNWQRFSPCLLHNLCHVFSALVGQSYRNASPFRIVERGALSQKSAIAPSASSVSGALPSLSSSGSEIGRV